jgi:hypothetical protein
MTFGMLLNGGANVGQPRAGLHCLDAQGKTLACDIEQTLRLWRDLTHRIGHASVTTPAVEPQTDIYSDDVSFAQSSPVG